MSGMFGFLFLHYLPNLLLHCLLIVKTENLYLYLCRTNITVPVTHYGKCSVEEDLAVRRFSLLSAAAGIPECISKLMSQDRKHSMYENG